MQSVDKFEPLFRPQSIAVVGASRKKHKLGHVITANIVGAGYKGKLYPVNPAEGEILGQTVYASCADLPEAPDLGIVIVPRDRVLRSLVELGRAGAGAVLVITAGFRETGREGFELEQEMANIATRWGFVLMGPNSLGLINTSHNLNASIAAQPPQQGNIGFFSQSGALCSAILDWASGEKLGFSKFLSLGNKAGISEADALEAMADDPGTSVIIGYLESLENGREFVRVAQKVTEKKPVIMIKAGTTQAGARATSSHTGSVSGSIEACKAAFAQSGILQVDDIESLFDLARSFSCQPLPKGHNLTVITNSGGPGILAADACEQAGLHLATPSTRTVTALRAALPAYASLYNPIDIIGDAGADRYRDTLEAVINDDMTHAVMMLLTPTASAQITETAQAIIDVAKTSDKPVFACFMGDTRVGPGRDMLLDAGIPCYAYPEPAVRALSAMVQQQRWQHRPWPVEVCFRRDKGKAEKLVRNALDIHLPELRQAQAFEMAMAYELPVPESKLARTSDQAAKAAKKIGYPVALKIVSPHIERRSGLDAVALNLETPQQVRAAFRDITNRVMRMRPGAYISGCLVQSMGPAHAREVRIRLRQDPQFGPMVGFSMAGPAADILGDEAWRLAPLTLQDAQEIVREIRSYPLLRGVRGQPPVNLGALEDMVMTVSQMADDFPNIREAELNPVLVDEHGALVADLRLTVG